MSGSSHIWSVLICVEYQNFCWTLDVYLLFAIWIDSLYVFCINWWLALLQTVVLATTSSPGNDGREANPSWNTLQDLYPVHFIFEVF